MTDPAYGLVLVSDDGGWTRAVADALRRRHLERLVLATPDSLVDALEGAAAVVVDGRLSGSAAASVTRAFGALADSRPRVVLLAAEAQRPHVDLVALADWHDTRLPDDEELSKLLTAHAAPRAGRAPELFRALVGESEAVRQLRAMVERVARTDATVLIAGEPGTGKEVFARNVHFRSHRRGQPFVAVNCASVPRELLDSDLFGHEAGAMSGALAPRAGRLERAEGGTLYIEAVEELPKSTQARLLRVLREGQYERLGSTVSRGCDVRIVAATSVDLEHEIAARRFREDLYYRLNVLPVHMPALRERREDIRALFAELMARHKAERGLETRIDRDAMELLEHHDWPGNVRELANLVERLCVLHPAGEVDRLSLVRLLAGRPSGLQPAVNGHPRAPAATTSSGLELPPGRVNLRSFVRDIERRLIERALREANGVTAHAATLLEMRRTTLMHKMKVLRPEVAVIRAQKPRRTA